MSTDTVIYIIPLSPAAQYSGLLHIKKRRKIEQSSSSLYIFNTSIQLFFFLFTTPRCARLSSNAG